MSMMMPTGPPGPPPGLGDGGDPSRPNPQAALLARMLTGGDQLDQGPPPDQANGQGMSELDVAQSIIQDLHDAMKASQDPGHVQIYATCLRAITGVQKELMGGAKGAGAGPPSYGGGR